MTSKNALPEHSPIGASGYYRWSKCPGSVEHLKRNPTKTSKYAEEGTLAHELFELRMSYELLGEARVNPDAQYPSDMHEHIEWCCEEVRQIHAGRDWDGVSIEDQFVLESIDPECFGRNDLAFWSDLDSLHVFDLKYGAGKVVEAEDNGQMMYYALGIVEEHNLDVPEIFMHILQPRVDDPHKVALITWNELMDFKATLKEAVKNVKRNPNAFTPDTSWGGHCQFCNTACCEAWHNEVEKDALVAFDDIDDELTDLPDITKFPTERLQLFCRCEDQVVDMFKKARATLQRRAEDGEEIPGMKLIQKLSNRRYKDPVKAAEYVKGKFGLADSDVYEQKLIGITKMKKLVPKDKHDKLESLFVRDDKGLSLVSENAKGEPVIPNDSSFDDIE